jgi:hypothetical protein
LTIGPNALFGGPLRDLIEISPEKRASVPRFPASAQS